MVRMVWMEPLTALSREGKDTTRLDIQFSSPTKTHAPSPHTHTHPRSR